MAKQPAIFLDRDGVINQDGDYVCSVDDFHFIDGSIEAMQALKQKGWLLVVVTNQSGIARGYFSEDDFLALTEWMDWSLVDRGVTLDGIYYCPHHPDFGQGDYRQVCDCRKPEPGMFLQAANELDIDLANSWMIGDKASDLLGAKRAEIAHRILVKSGKEVTEQAKELAESIVDDLSAAAKLILAK
ncbi:D-glycero-beta-D-manno-heptose 1,7-bisphosphate 7-phosphatase [Celerinatantimonas sp. MCCC 1A17872]|uniref:D-glycero-beta-D-manno-heptose 1,7-bisphosphate 7-phosphatase n=1 Tax=Celerinatantimonas sp. MCCC 1A17872 TaxID=3177514 RepID=UPI0038C1F4CB